MTIIDRILSLPTAIPLAPTTGIKDILLHMDQNLLEVVENLHAIVSTDPNNTDDNKAIIRALQQAQQALEQKKKKQVRFDGVEMPMRKGKALESILKHPDQAGAAKENQSSAAGPSAPVSRITVSTPAITASANRDITTTAIKILLPLTPLVRNTVIPPLSRTLPLSLKLLTAPSTSLSPSLSENYSPSPQRCRSSTKN
jgi:hypothetical protein